MAVFLSECFGGGPDVSIPHFDGLSYEEVCGGVPNKCQPTSSTRYTSVNALDFPGDYGELLGRKFKRSSGGGIFETRQCATESVDIDDVDIEGENRITASIRQDSRNNLATSVSADIAKTITSGISSELPTGTQADLSASLEFEIDRLLNQAVNMIYHRASLSTSFMDSAGAECISSLGAGEVMITGISIIESSGNWSSSAVSDILRDFEASASYIALEGSARNTYERNKNRVLSGNFSPVSFVFSVAYQD